MELDGPSLFRDCISIGITYTKDISPLLALPDDAQYEVHDLLSRLYELIPSLALHLNVQLCNDQ